MTQPAFPLLHRIDFPEDLRCLEAGQLTTLAAELRAFLIDSISRTGGHLAASLGTVELTIALHYVFNTPQDRLVWDVGHQSYAHKILTGRRDAMATLRRKDGLSGFPKRSESDYDSFGVGHSSTSISAATGMAIAAAKEGGQRKVVAIIGDGAMTAGQAFEALNHAGDLGHDLLVILNDNDMSISPNVGALSNYFGRILAGRTYATMRKGGKRVLQTLPHAAAELARRAEEHMKGMVVPGTLFEELGFNYVGPIDGHDLPGLVKTLRNLRSESGPRLLHIVTRKGKGYAPAEKNPCAFHGVGGFDPATGTTRGGGETTPTYTQVFSDWICDMAAEDPRLIAITPAMREGSGLVKFSEQYPDRYYDVGIAEQHAVTLAAGLACEGYHPVVAIYSTFLQRGYDQLIHDVAIQNLPVTFAIDRAGLVGPDGATHAGSFDLSYLRCIPNLLIMAPADENECRQMLSTAHRSGQPAAVRYPRGKGNGSHIDAELNSLKIGTAQVRRRGQRVAILAFGSLLDMALEVGEKLDASVVNMRFIKPLDQKLLAELALNHCLLVTLEDNALAGGAGSAVAESLSAAHHPTELLMLGLPDRFLNQGSREELLAECGLNPESIAQRINQRLSAGNCGADADRLVS